MKNLTINNSTFINNTAIESGGPIQNSGVNVTIDNSNFIGNKASDTSAIDGGSSPSVNLTIINSNFTNNSGIGVIYISSNDSTIKYCNIFNMKVE